MGAWGVNILEEDFAADAHGEYIERYNAGASHDSILADMLVSCADQLEDDAVGFWLGLAKAQWECGALSDRAHDEVARIVKEGIGLSAWGEPGEKGRRDRERALTAFLAKLASPNPKPKKRRKGTIRKPIFQAGDCLAIRLEGGDYAAAIVTAVVEETPRPGADTYGINVIAQLRFKSPNKPALDDFEKRDWLILTWGSWKNKPQVLRLMSLQFKAVRDRFEVVGKTTIREDDPKESRTFTGWEFAEQVSHQLKSEGT